jgi:hypothetical protein
VTDRERAFLYGIAAGLFCYVVAAYGAGWTRLDAGLTAAFWTATVYYIARKSQES